jgi:hypothetical protein
MITNRTGEDVTGAVLPLLGGGLLQLSTALESAVYVARPMEPRAPTMLTRIWGEATGYGWLRTPILSNLITEGDPGEFDATGQQVIVRITGPLGVHRSGVAQVIAKHGSTLEAQAVENIRAASGLPLNRVSDLLGVSRPTLYKWREGITPRGRAREHLFRTAQLLEDAAGRLGDAASVSSWLLTPISSSGQTPFELLRDKRYDMFRGFLLRKRTSDTEGKKLLRARHPVEPDRVQKSLEQLKPMIPLDDIIDAPAEE